MNHKYGKVQRTIEVWVLKNLASCLFIKKCEGDQHTGELRNILNPLRRHIISSRKCGPNQLLKIMINPEVKLRADKQHCAALRMEQIDHFSKLHSISYSIIINDQSSFSFVVRRVEVAL